MVESPMNEVHVRMYQPGGAKTQTPVGQGGTIAMTSRWADRVLTSEGTSQAATGASTAVKETLRAQRRRQHVDDRDQRRHARSEDEHA